MRVHPLLLLGTALFAACASEEKSMPATADSAAPAASMASDPDNVTAGGGVPAGYAGRTDRAGQSLAEASYAAQGNRWEVRTGPAHTVWAAADTASGAYTVTATFDVLTPPEHPEAFGLFIGGRDLDQPGQQYTYFLVRNTGEYLVKVRDGGETRNVVSWTASPDVPKAEKASYTLAMRVGSDSVHYLVNDKQVAATPRSAIPATDGTAGLRINHNLHLMVTPLTIQR